MHVIRTGAKLLRAVAFLAGGALSAAAQEPNDITLRLTATTGNPGDTVEVTANLEAGDVLPETFVIFLAYDAQALAPLPEAYEIIARDEFTGDPILDDDGNTIADFSLVRLAGGAVDAGKFATFEIYESAGAVGIVVHGLNQVAIPEGELLTVAFRILPTVMDGSMTDVIGLDETSAIHVPDGMGGVRQLISSFSRTVQTDSGTEVEALTYRFEDVSVIVGCIPANPPSGVTATQNRSDAVLVAWNAVAGSNLEYRVYRGTTSNVASAVPIGEAWQTGTSFSDITARVPEVIPGECLEPEQVSEVHYFYWVRARSQEGCESELSATPAEGFRVQAAKLLPASMFPMEQAGGRLVIYGIVLVVLFSRYAGRGCASAPASTVEN